MADDMGTGGLRDPLRDVYRRNGGWARRRRRWPIIVILLCVIGGVGYYFLRPRAETGPAPLIKAQVQPYKVKPQDPGGAEPPAEDQAQSQGGTPNPSVEKLAPPAEAPLPHPTPDQAGAAATGPSTATGPGTAAAPPAGQPSATPPDAAASQSAPASPAPPAAQAQRQANLAPSASPATTPGASAGEEWRVQLGALRASSEAEHEWQRLQKRHGDLLGQLSVNIQRVDLGQGKGIFYRIQAGPLAGREAAAALCGKLKSAGVVCIAVKP
jgi:cell division septation protein DedD